MIADKDIQKNESTQPPLVPHSYPWKIKILLLTLPICFIYALCFLPESFEVKKALQTAEKAYRQNNYDQSLAGYLSILQKNPHLKSARIGAAESLFVRNNAEDESRQIALGLLTDIKLKKEEYARIEKVMPKEYKEYFKNTRD